MGDPGVLEQFADTVNKNLSTQDFLTKRAIIRALVKQIEVYKEEVIIIFRVAPSAPTNEHLDNISENGKNQGDLGFSQDCSKLQTLVC